MAVTFELKAIELRGLPAGWLRALHTAAGSWVWSPHLVEGWKDGWSGTAVRWETLLLVNVEFDLMPGHLFLCLTDGN